MNWITELLLGRPVSLLLYWVAMQFILICIWSARRDRTAARLVWSGFAAIALLQTAALLIDTPAERIVALCRAMAKAVDEGEITTLARHLHSDFTAGGLDKEEFVSAVSSALTRYRVDNPRLRRFAVEFPAEGEARATFNASSRVRTARSYGHIPSRWRAHFRDYQGTWQLTRLESLPVPPLHVADLGQWLR